MANDNPLSPEILISAYTQGYFPMPDENTGKVNWYRPDPRATIPLDGFHVSKSLRRLLQKGNYEVLFSKDFQKVMQECANRKETWITPEFVKAYSRLHRLGFAHSLEIYQKGELVGGTYGVSIRGCFFAESMFHKKANMSKVALFELTEHLKAKKFHLLECQFLTPHLESLGAIAISDKEYQKKLREGLEIDTSFT